MLNCELLKTFKLRKIHNAQRTLNHFYSIPVKKVIEIHAIINLGTGRESVNESNQYPLH